MPLPVGKEFVELTLPAGIERPGKRRQWLVGGCFAACFIAYVVAVVSLYDLLARLAQ
jgi:hypothetical protein